MTRKIVSIILVISMVLWLLLAGSGTQGTEITRVVEEAGFEITLVENDVKREAKTEVEGMSLKCEYFYGTDEYLMYLDDEPIPLNVIKYDDHVEVALADEQVVDYENNIVGQAVLTLSIAAPVLITAAETILGVVAGGLAVYVSANVVGTVISGIRSNSKTYERYRTVDVSAANMIKYGKLSKGNAYYMAELRGNTVMISKEISVWAAIRRMELGLDVFCTTQFAAAYVATQAATLKGRFYVTVGAHKAHDEGFYPHYHAYGRRWYKDSQYSPHAWYPF